ncbi:hypothetical protein K488DRAFT_73601, partial [Vararia minispora EC-137]
ASASRADALTLTLVSSAARRAALPALYRAVFLRDAHHVALFAAPFTSTRRTPRLRARPPVRALALCVSARLPSLERALASVAAAGAFTHLTALALTAPLLAAHAHWLRVHSITPHTLMIFHHGLPQPLDFRAPFLAHVHTLYTPELSGFRRSSPADLPALRRIALCARAHQPPGAPAALAVQIAALLAACPALEILVLALHTRPHREQYDAAPWRAALASLTTSDPRLRIVPFARPARLEWRAAIADDSAVRSDVFADADALAQDPGELRVRADAVAREAETFKAWPPAREWDLDVHAAPGYVHGKTGVDYPGTPAPATWL